MRRRRFVTMAGAGVASLSLPISMWAQRPQGMRMGLVTYLWGKDWDVPTLIRNCEAAALTGVELRTEHAHGVEPSITKVRRQEVRAMFEGSKVEVVGLGTNLQYDFVEPERVRESIQNTLAFIRLSADIGGSGVKVKPNAFHEGVPHEKTLEQIGRALNEVGRMAADYGQKIRLEVHGEGTQELPNIKTIMDVADHPSVVVCWNCNDQDLWGGGLKYNFNLVKERIGDTVHVRELNVGSYPYAELMNLLCNMNYKGWILLECRTDPADKIAAMIEQRLLWERMCRG